MYIMYIVFMSVHTGGDRRSTSRLSSALSSASSSCSAAGDQLEVRRGGRQKKLSTEVAGVLHRRRRDAIVWLQEEDNKLILLVRRLGCCWSRIVQSGELGGRSETAIRNRWQRLQAPGASTLPVATAGSQRSHVLHVTHVLPETSHELSCGSQTAPRHLQSSGGGALRAVPRPSTRSRGTMARLDLTAAPARNRSDAHGRGWTRVLSAPHVPAWLPTPSEELLRALLVALPRPQAGFTAVYFEDVRRRWKAAAGLPLAERRAAAVVGVRKRKRKLRTLLAARSHVPWLVGPRQEDDRFLQAHEAAAMMGLRSQSGRSGGSSLEARLWKEACALLKPRALWSAVADSIDSHHTQLLLGNGLKMLRPELRRQRSWRYASLYSGGFDAFFLAARRLLGDVEHVMGAELDKRRAQLLKSVFGAEVVYDTAEEASRSFRAPFDILAVSPSCKGVSSIRYLSRGKLTLRKLRMRAKVEAIKVALQIKALARACKPMIIVIEQSSGLLTHHKCALAAFQAVIRRLPYVWRFGCVDCATQGAAHDRKRLGWVGVLDCCCAC